MAQIYIETHGCQMNEADSQDIARRAVSAGFTLAERPEDAAVLVLNTCTVRDNAERRAYGRIGHWKAIKNADPSVKVVVTGCLAEQDKDRMQRLVPHVDAVFGTSELGALGDALAVWRGEYPDDGFTVDREIDTIIGGAGEGIAGPYDGLRGYVTVQRGCSYYCTFCIVPHVRGRFDHRPMREILDEIRVKTAAGAREITLVGQTVNAYKEPATGADFADLLEEVCAIDAVERVMFVSSHPKDLNEKLARICATLPKMNPRFHLALQSGSNPMLRRMNRKYTLEQFLERIATFKSYNPGWAITTDLIVGFPGETEDDFLSHRRGLRDGDLRAGVHVHLLAATRDAGGSLARGQPDPPRRRAGSFQAARRGAGRGSPPLSRSQDRHDRARTGARRLAQRQDAALRQDDRQRHGQLSDDRGNARYGASVGRRRRRGGLRVGRSRDLPRSRGKLRGNGHAGRRAADRFDRALAACQAPLRTSARRPNAWTRTVSIDA